MIVEKVFGTIGSRTVLKTNASYTPYVICSGYNPSERPGQQWSSAYGYYRTKQDLAGALAEMIADGDEFHGELIF